nr:uncharacterized protein LOC129383388 [Dermacentor andersoni]
MGATVADEDFTGPHANGCHSGFTKFASTGAQSAKEEQRCSDCAPLRKNHHNRMQGRYHPGTTCRTAHTPQEPKYWPGKKRCAPLRKNHHGRMQGRYHPCTTCRTAHTPQEPKCWPGKKREYGCLAVCLVEVKSG